MGGQLHLERNRKAFIKVNFHGRKKVLGACSTLLRLIEIHQYDADIN